MEKIQPLRNFPPPVDSGFMEKFEKVVAQISRVVLGKKNQVIHTLLMQYQVIIQNHHIFIAIFQCCFNPQIPGSSNLIAFRVVNYLYVFNAFVKIKAFGFWVKFWLCEVNNQIKGNRVFLGFY